MSAIPELSQCNVFASRQAARFITQIYDRHLGAAHMTSSQFSILVALCKSHGIGLVALGEQLVMDRTSLLRALKVLVRDGFVCEWRTTPSSRKAALGLTAQGLAHLRAAVPYWRQAQDELADRIGLQNTRQLRRDQLAATAKRGAPS